MKIADVDTPALLLDLDVMQRNLETMADWCRRHDVNLRPHFKVHRCPALAKRQLAAGAIGITTAKLAEAELLASHGIDNLLVANQIVGAPKLRRLTALARRMTVLHAVDNADVAVETARAATVAGVELPVLVEVDVGMNRGGVPGAPEAVALAQRVADLHGLAFAGLMGYAGQTVVQRRGPEKDEQIRQAIEGLLEARRAIESAGLTVGICSSGGTGSFHVTGTLPGITELQCGTYLLMDDIFTEADAPFEQAMAVLATVTTVRGTRVVCDAGAKAIHPRRVPRVLRPAGLCAVAVNAEHCLLDAHADPPRVRVGDKIALSVHYADGTFNLHDRYYAHRGDEVVEELAIEGRNCSR